MNYMTIIEWVMYGCNDWFCCGKSILATCVIIVMCVIMITSKETAV